MLKTNSVTGEPQFKGPLFIFGTARSGTSFLKKLVNSIPGVNLVFESDIIQSAYQISKNRDVLVNRSVFEEYLRHLERKDRGSSPRPNTPLFVQPSHFYDELYERFREHRNFRIFIKELYCAGARDTLIWGDKTADINQLPAISQLFPDARFIFIIRDVRAVVNSFYKHSLVNYYTPSFFWVKMARLARSFQKENSSRVMVIRYEDMVLQTREIFERITSFLGRESDNLSVADQAHDSSLDKWRDRLTTEEVRRVEEICFEEMRHYGYNIEQALQPRKMNKFRYGFLLAQNALALLRRRRTTLRSLFSLRGIIKYIRIYREW